MWVNLYKYIINTSFTGTEIYMQYQILYKKCNESYKTTF